MCTSSNALHETKKTEKGELRTKSRFIWNGNWHRGTPMTNVAVYRCEECDTIFDSEQELIQHNIYAKYRRPGYCRQW